MSYNRKPPIFEDLDDELCRIWNFPVNGSPTQSYCVARLSIGPLLPVQMLLRIFRPAS